MADPISTPFLKEKDGSLVLDSGDFGAAALSVILTSFLGGIADVITAIFESLIIGPIESVSDGVTRIIEELLTIPAGVLNWEPAISFAQETGFVGALVLVAVGGYLIALTVEAIR